ncbi:phosphotransferase family protein [Streptomyces sp. NPDC044780]|uniref:phosphotransferase family protein n=1 Tax=unclassified Streptomyces TaxID=2593676 RepID=UPI0033D5ACB9
MSDTDPPGLSLSRLRTHLDQELPGLVHGPLRGELIDGGRSNLTYVVTDGSSRWVVRRPPLGHVLATAHNMAREHRVITALHPTAVPVPQPVLLCQDPDVLGAPFYAMEYVGGTPYRTRTQLAALGPDRTRAIALRLLDTLVDLHSVDPYAVGLSDFGRPQGFLERQLRRWRKQLDASRSRHVPGVQELHDRLVGTLPAAPESTVVHGDYRLDNALIGADDRIRAVLDWEMSTLGDPLTDLALLVVYARLGAGDDDGPVSNAASAPGYPSTDEIVARYAHLSGRDVSALSWYIGLASFKLAVVLEGIHYRFSQGQTVGAGFNRIGALVAPLVALGLAHLKED